MFTSSLPEVSSKKDTPKHETNPKENNNAEVRSKQSRFASLKPHSRTDVPPRICSAPTEHRSAGEHLWGTASVCQKSFKRLKLSDVVIYSC